MAQAGWEVYLQPDPIGLEGGLKLYAYASNIAISNFDRWGLFGEGGPGAKFKGHRDFTSGGFLNYNLEVQSAVMQRTGVDRYTSELVEQLGLLAGENQMQPVRWPPGSSDLNHFPNFRLHSAFL